VEDVKEKGKGRALVHEGKEGKVYSRCQLGRGKVEKKGEFRKRRRKI